MDGRQSCTPAGLVIARARAGPVVPQGVEGDPMAHRSNLAASLGGGSARHRITAIVGWLLLVIVALLIGSAAGQVTMTQAEYGSGESGRAQWLLTNAGVANPAQELVLVHSATAPAGTPGFQAAVAPSWPACRAPGGSRTCALPWCPPPGTTC